MNRSVALPFLLLVLSVACVPTQHAKQPSQLGKDSSSRHLLAVLQVPGPLTLETVRSADWQIDRSGLLNLDHPHARAAKLEDGPEPIQIYFHVVRHPTRGVFLIDSGVERALRDAPKKAAVRGLVARFGNAEHLKVTTALGDWLAHEGRNPAGVFLTHLHLDHVMGMPDVPRGTPVYVGPGELEARAFQNLFVQGTIDRALEGMGPLNVWRFQADAQGRFEGVIDVFGDGSLFALWVPGHTPGSTAFLARTVSGPVLIVGDTSHTAWGWEHGVEPGKFTADSAKNAQSLRRLKDLTSEHPSIRVLLGHQAFGNTSSAPNREGSAAP